MTRRLVGLAGAPGAGKTTWARAHVASLAVPATHLAMDGFHLADRVLDDLGLRERKGAPETFDAWGYAALLHRLRTPEPHPVYAPGFERDLEQPLAAAVVVAPETELVLTEGNYLLLDEEPWRAVRAALDEVWFLDVDDELRRERLIARHVAFGKTPAAADAWVREVDDVNAALVLASRARADRVVHA